VCAIVIVAGLVVVFTRNKKPIESQKPLQLILKKDVGMADKQKQVFVDRIEGLKKKLSDLGVTDQTKVDRYDLLKTIGNNYFSIGEFSEAKNYYLQASSISQDDPAIWFLLATVEVQMTDYQAADEHIAIAIKLDKINPEYWRLKFDLATQFLGATDAQVKALVEQAKDATGTNPDILTYYAKYLAGKGDATGAVEQWNKAREVNPAGQAVYDKEIKALQSTGK
jgi:tetratricopeptide (TPR) repeat protein